MYWYKSSYAVDNIKLRTSVSETLYTTILTLLLILHYTVHVVPFPLHAEIETNTRKLPLSSKVIGLVIAIVIVIVLVVDYCSKNCSNTVAEPVLRPNSQTRNGDSEIFIFLNGRRRENREESRQQVQDWA